MNRMYFLLISLAVASALFGADSLAVKTGSHVAAANPEMISDGLTIEWDKKFLTIRGDFPGDEIRIHYLEAYCRDGSTDRDWKETVIRHESEQLGASRDGKQIRLRDRLADGVVVDHVIVAGKDEVTFEITAHNPTDERSRVHWAQPCMRVDPFTGTTNTDARDLVPAYARQSFIFVDGEQKMLPTEPWAKEARYTPGQVYCPKGVDRNDVNPRPLSALVPSNHLMGCYSADKQKMLAVAFDPCQELFLGVIACIHSDLRIGGLKPGETKTIRGKIYVIDADVQELLRRYREDFLD